MESLSGPRPQYRAGKPLAVALITPGFPPQLGGVERVVGNLAEALARRDHEVTVLAHRPRSWTPPSLESGDFTVKRFPDWTGSRQFRVAPGLWKHLRECSDRYEVLHAHSFHASAALAAARMTDAPLVFTPHYHGVGHTVAARAVHFAYDRLAGRIFDRSSSVICVSRAEAEMVSHDYPRAARKVVVIPNGVEVLDIAAAVPLAIDRPVVLVSGRLESYKQVALCIRAFAHLDSEPLLVITGSGPESGRLRSLTYQLGLEHRVQFAGHVDDSVLRRWQRTASVSLNLSRHEAFGLVVLEAAIAGARVVATAIPAHTELAEKLGDLAVLVPVDASPAEIASALREQLVYPNEGVRVLDARSWSEIAERTESEYQRALSGA
jgi:glycosyltransferase involved in cell wall biosynthesis